MKYKKTKLHCLHISQSKKGVPNFKLRRGKYVFCLQCNKSFWAMKKNLLNGKGKFCSQKCYWINKIGKPTWNKGTRGYKQPNISKALTGKKLSMDTRRKMSVTRKGKYKGKNNPMWKGGLTSKNMIIRHTFEYYEWANKVKERDDYTCQICKVRGNNILHSDHIKPFALYPELRFDINNGRTLCIDCHRKTETYGNRLYKKFQERNYL